MARCAASSSVGDAEGEVLEAEVMSTSSIAGVALRDVGFPEGVLVGGVRKPEGIVKPSGALRIEAGDVVVIFALAADVAAVERLLQVSVDYF